MLGRGIERSCLKVGDIHPIMVFMDPSAIVQSAANQAASDGMVLYFDFCCHKHREVGLRPAVVQSLLAAGPVEFNPSSAYLPGDVADGTGCPSGRAGGTKYPSVSVFRN
jgi:hypothetical protein